MKYRKPSSAFTLLFLLGIKTSFAQYFPCKIDNKELLCSEIITTEWEYSSQRCNGRYGPFENEMDAVRMGVLSEYKPANCAGPYEAVASQWGGYGSCGSSKFYPKSVCYLFPDRPELGPSDCEVETINAKSYKIHYSFTRDGYCLATSDGLTVYRNRLAYCPKDATGKAD